MQYLVLFVLTYIIVYFVYYLMVLKKEDKVKKMKKSTELSYLKKVYHINLNNYDLNWLVKKVIIVNTLIISIAVAIASFASNIIWMLLLGFVILFPSILLLYHILGIYLKKKESRR